MLNNNLFGKSLLINGDSINVLPKLIHIFGGSIKCIYLDPPYASNTINEHYSDVYLHDEYVDMLLSIINNSKNLLSNDGFIFVQINESSASIVKKLLDKVFGISNFRNFIIVRREDHKEKSQISKLQSGFDIIFLYSKTESILLPSPIISLKSGMKSGYWKDLYRTSPNPQNQYSLFGVYPKKGEWRVDEESAKVAIQNYYDFISNNEKIINNNLDFDMAYNSYLKSISKQSFPMIRYNNRIEYYVPSSNKIVLTNNWSDLEIRGYETSFEHEVNIQVLERIITWIVNENEYILDPFLGSGTSAIAAQKLNRKWIGIEKETNTISEINQRLISSKNDFLFLEMR